MVATENYTQDDMILRVARGADNIKFVAYDPTLGIPWYIYCEEREPRTQLVIGPDEFRRLKIDGVQKSLCRPGEALGFCSTVAYRGEILHTPQIDFECPVSEDNEDAVREVLHELRLDSGILINSGRSYHFQGVDVMPKAEWPDFLGSLFDYTIGYSKDWLTSDVINPDWIHMTASQGYSFLRVTAAANKAEPKIIDYF
jgi:hypothetical protein